MIKEVIALGKDITEAKENARIALGADELADVQYEILHAGTKGLLGFFVKPARVKATIELPDSAPKRPARPERSEKKPQAPRENNHQQKSGDAPRRNGNKGEHKPQPQKNASPKKRSEIVPENEIKLTLIEKADGEDRSLDFVKTLIKNLGIDAEAKLYAAEDGSRRIILSGESASILIGHHGDTLDSLQYLANLASAQPNASGERDHSRVTIDIEGYRAKREEALRALARRMAEKSLRNKRNVTLEPMNPYERRIIHDEVSTIEGVMTSSIGSDTSRRVVIFYDKNGSKAEEANEAVAPEATETAPDNAD